MNIPGFNAEESISRKSGYYHLVGVFDQSDVTMHPANWIVKVGVKEGIEVQEGFFCEWQYNDCLKGRFRRCCQKCRNDLYKTCVPFHGLEFCKGLYRSTCSPRCNAWELGGCDQLVPF